MEIYEYMVDHNLLVLDDDYTFQQGYTTALPEYSESYIYMTFYGSNFYSWFTNGISHEFGHFIDWYYNLDDFASKGNNFAESVSVSFSYICNDELDAYFDDPTKSNLLCVSNVIDNTLNYVNSCLSINDLEVYAFQNRDTITPSDLEDTYIQLTYDYGMCSSVAYQLGCLREDNSYVTTNQVYVQPFYTIDYAMAGLSALSILDAYAEDNEAGLALFDTLYDNDYYDYITLMKDGLGIDLYADGYVYNITQNLDAYLKGKLADAVDGYDSGDVNLDGNVDVTDLLALKKYLLGMEVSNFNSTTADVNGDGTINVLDLLTLKKVLLGMDE
jgi:oligoendopeptidase F